MRVGTLQMCALLWLGLSACVAQSNPWPETSRASQAPQPALLRTQFGAFARATSLPALRGIRRGVPALHAERNLFLVQFAPGRATTTRLALLGLGATVHGYFPDDAWSVDASATQARAIAALDDVRAVSQLPAALKLDAPMLVLSGRGLALAPGKGTADLWVEMAQADDAEAVGDAVVALGGHVVTEGRDLQILRVVVPRDEVTTLAQMPEVLALQPWSMPTASNDVSYGVIQGGEARQAPMWDHGLRGQGQIIGLSDSGVDTYSCYFAGDKIVGYREFTGIHDGDGTGHGTHVAGSIAGNMGGDGLTHAHDGMAPAARLFVEDVGAGADLVGIPGDLAGLFGPAFAAGARIHSNSWVGGSAKYGVMSRALDRFVAAHPDFLPLFAAGNTGRRGNGQVLEPALAKNVVAVGALDGAHPNDMAAFSARGPTADGRIKPMVAAPGIDIVSAQADAACDTQTLSGTSMATPTAAGGVALVRQYYTEGYYPTGRARAADARDPSAALLKATLLVGSVDMAQQTRGDATSTKAGQGFGRIQLDRALVFDARAKELWLHDETQGLDDGQAMTFTLHVNQGGQAARVALAWTDPPASPGAGHALVNDLDLEVTSPDGVTYRGNAIVAGASAQAGERDSDNVEEVVTLPAAAAGNWQVTVRGTHVPMGSQNFALVAAGDFAS